MWIFELSALVTRLRAMTQLTSRLSDDSPFNSEASKQGGTNYITTASVLFSHSAMMRHHSKAMSDTSRNFTKTVI